MQQVKFEKKKCQDAPRPTSSDCSPPRHKPIEKKVIGRRILSSSSGPIWDTFFPLPLPFLTPPLQTLFRVSKREQEGRLGTNLFFFPLHFAAFFYNLSFTASELFLFLFSHPVLITTCSPLSILLYTHTATAIRELHRGAEDSASLVQTIQL